MEEFIAEHEDAYRDVWRFIGDGDEAVGFEAWLNDGSPKRPWLVKVVTTIRERSPSTT